MKNEKSNHGFEYMPLDKKSNEDFNNQHPDHDENGLINASAIASNKYAGSDKRRTSDMKTTETTSNQSKRKEATKTYTCPMHPEVISDKPGKCPKCGMELIEKK